jgi:hypothetical protein
MHYRSCARGLSFSATISVGALCEALICWIDEST